MSSRFFDRLRSTTPRRAPRGWLVWRNSAAIGPELTGVGGRFSRIHIVESILQPSRIIAPSYQPLTVLLGDGLLVTCVKLAETAEHLTLGDQRGEKHVLAKADIEERQPQTTSVMPDGLERLLTQQQFVDLLTFLVELK